MRVDDRPLPPVTAHPMPAGRPIRPVIAIEPATVGGWQWNDPGLLWDDPALAWDAPAVVTAWADAFCDYYGLVVESGGPDDHSNFAAARAVVQIDNRDGVWSRYTVDGALMDYGPGRHLAVWATDGAGGAWWLFYGRIARWDQRADDTVEVEAFDALSDLAQPIGTYTPGVAGEKTAPRLTAICAAAGFFDRTRFDPLGAVTLTRQLTDQAPLEEMQTVIASDGGVLYGDADGTVVATTRTWRNGRTDQAATPVLSDNVCSSPVIVWDPTISNTDDLLADLVILENVAHLRATAMSTFPLARYTYADLDQQWTTQAEGDQLAAHRVVEQGRARARLDDFALYLFDPLQPELWRAVDWRIGDRLRFVHDAAIPGGVARLDITALAASIVHEITPEGWVMTVATSRAIDYTVGAAWDGPQLVWDDPALVWGY